MAIQNHITPIFPFDTWGLFLLDSTGKYHFDLVEDELQMLELTTSITSNLGKFTWYIHKDSGIETFMETTTILNIEEVIHPQT